MADNGQFDDFSDDELAELMFLRQHHLLSTQRKLELLEMRRAELKKQLEEGE